MAFYCFVVSGFLLVIDSKTVMGRLMLCAGIVAYVYEAVHSGRLYHVRFARNFTRSKSPFAFWFFVGLALFIFLVTAIDATSLLVNSS